MYLTNLQGFCPSQNTNSNPERWKVVRGFETGESTKAWGVAHGFALAVTRMCSVLIVTCFASFLPNEHTTLACQETQRTMELDRETTATEDHEKRHTGTGSRGPDRTQAFVDISRELLPTVLMF